MSELTAQRVEYRRVIHAEAVAIEEGDEVFLALSTPPPVRTRLRVVIGDDEVRGFEVLRVREVESQERGRGAFGRWIDAGETGAGMPVGSEAYEGPQPPPSSAAETPPEPEVDAEGSESEAHAEDPQTQETTEAAETESEAAAENPDGASAEATDGDADADEKSDSGRSRRGKKRKGRKRG